MGLLDLLLGRTNPVSMFVDSNRNAVHGGFAGLGRATNIGDAFAGFATGANAGGPADEQEQQLVDEQTARQQQINQTMRYLQAKFPDLADAVNAGLPISDAWAEAFKRSAPGYGAKAEDGGFSLNPGEIRYDKGGKIIAQAPASSKTPDAPNGYQWTGDGKLSYIPGGPADPSTPGKTTEATRRNQQLAKVMGPEADALLGDGTSANPGTFDSLANGWDQARDAGGTAAMVLGQGPSAAYQEAKNSIRTIIASYLYSVSGATANPGEVENQAAVLTPKPGENPASVAAKKARLAQMVQAVNDAAQGTTIPAGNDPSSADDVVDYTQYFGTP